MQLVLQFVLGLSILLQVIAAYFAVRLIKITGLMLAWMLVASAVILMAGRRGVKLYEIIADDFTTNTLDFTGEIIALTISVLMLVGIAGVARELELAKKAAAKRAWADATIREVGQRASLALQSAKAGAWEWFIGNNKTSWSDENYRVMGLEPGECEPTYENWLSRVHPDDRVYAEQRIEQAFNNKTDMDFEFRLIEIDGVERWIQDVGKIVFDAGGKPLGMYGIQTDITERKQAELQLKERERAYYTLLSNLSGMAYRCRNDATRSMDFVSDACTKITGYTAADLLENNTVAFVDLIHPDDQGWLAQKCQANLDAQLVCSNEYRIINKAGDIIWVWDQARGVYSESGELLGIEGLITDITASKHITQEWRKERDFSQAVFNTIGSVVTVLDRNGDMVEFNQTAMELTGYQQSEVLGRKVWDFLIPPAEVAGIKEVFKHLTMGHFPNRYENSWLTKTGEARRIAWNNAALSDEDGEVVFVIATGVDITEQRALMAEVEQDNLEWTQAMDAFEDAVYLSELDSSLVRANQAFYRLTELTPETAEGRSITDIMHPDGEKEKCPVCAARESLQDEYITLEPGADNRFPNPVEVMVRVIRDDAGQPVRILGTIRDLTRTRQIEAELRGYRFELEELVAARTTELKRANEELEAFSYSVSHDLRGPLRAMDGYSQILIEDYGSTLDDKGLDFLHRVRINSQRMGVLIEGLLGLSRINSHAMQVQEIDLTAMAVEIVAGLQESNGGRSVDWAIDENLVARGDASLVRVLLVNLLENAWKYTAKQDNVRIELSVKTIGGKPVYCVADNGAGFDMQFQDKLFKSFQRLHSNAEGYDGTGIGLATVKRVVDRHGGEIWAESRPAEGAKFFFTLQQ